MLMHMQGMRLIRMSTRASPAIAASERLIQAALGDHIQKAVASHRATCCTNRVIITTFTNPETLHTLL
jgi:hypothetical protein